VAVGVEVARSGTDVILTGCRLEAAEAEGVAVSVWAPAGQGVGPARIEMDTCEIRAGRVLALNARSGRTSVSAHGNRFHFRHELLSLTDCPSPPGRAVAWQGRENHYAGTGAWLRVEGAPGSVRGLRAWEALWGRTEPGSREAAPQ
jgi:hypothetical protein